MKEKPNIIFILADDMGYGDFSYFNNGLSDTPVLDELIKEGICLTQHYSASPVCAPARASLLTGRYPHRTGAIDTLEMNGLDRLSLKEITIADFLKADGYTTGLIGKWHLGAIEYKYHPNRRGFTEFVGFRGGWQDYYKWNLWYNDKLVKSDGRYLTDVFTEEAINFIKRHKKEKFFLHLTYNAPHFPFQAPDEVVKPFIEKRKFTKGVCYIYGMIKRMDEGIGKILQCLEDEGIEKNTIIFFTSDNGPQFGGEGEWSITRFNYNFKGHKGNVYEGGIRVPMVIKWQDTIEKGKIINEMEKIDYGKWKLLKPPVPETMKFPEKFGEIDVEYTYHPEKFNDIIRDPIPEFKIEKENPSQLYNIEEDPFEENDLSKEYPEIVEKMERETDIWFEEVEKERRDIKE